MIGIVGGGISGLFLLHLLREQGVDAVLFEASENPGGVMRSLTLDGPDGPVTVDLGPQRVRLTRGLGELVSELDLASSLVHAKTGVAFTMYRKGRLYPAPLSLTDALATPLISWPGKLRALADLVTAPPSPTESVADALRRKLGPEIYERLAGPLLGGLYASSPEEMEARHTLLPALGRTGANRSLLLALLRTRKWDRLPVVSFEGGMGMLPEALVARHRSSIRLGTPVATLVKSGGKGFALEVPGDRIPVRAVLLTMPAPEAARILHTVDPTLAELLGGLRYNPLGVVPLVVPGTTKPPSVGSGFKMTLDEPAATRGVTAHTTLFGRPGLFTAFLGGMGGEEVLDRPDEAIMKTAEDDFRAVTGADAEALMVHRTRMPAWDRSWRALDLVELPHGLHLCTAFTSRPGIPGRLEEARRVADRLTG